MICRMTFPIESPPMIELGEPPLHIEALIHDMVSDVRTNPGYTEPGRLSRRIILGTQEDHPLLRKLAMAAGETFLDCRPEAGSLAVVSVVTDAEAFREASQNSKAATNWHQDFESEAEGFFFPPADRTRLIIPTLVAPAYKTGSLKIEGAIHIPAEEDPSQSADKAAALSAGPVVLGADGVLMKSEPEPAGGELRTVEPNGVYIIPRDNVHRAPLELPTGRVFFQLDALPA
jgi:hypothetical protein